MTDDDREVISLLMGYDTTGYGDDVGRIFKKMEAENAKLEARVAELGKCRQFVAGFAMRAKTDQHDPDEKSLLLNVDNLLFERDCDITEARTLLRNEGDSNE